MTCVALCAAGPAAPQTGTAPGKPRGLNIEAITNTTFSGDFDQLLERRQIRFAAPYSRTLFYSDKGRERGLTAELARDFEQYVNRKYAKQLGKRPLTVVLIPSTRTELIEDVANGLADIGAGNLSVTEARLQKVDMVAPEDLKPMSEVLLTGPKSPAVATIDDLAGKTIHLRPSSSYYESVTKLNDRFRKEGKPPVTIIKLPDALEDEDIMEMLNAGLLQFAVVDDWKAKIWAQILPNVKVREDIVLAGGTRPGWAIRKGSPKLRAELEEFYTNYVKKQGTHAYRVTQLQKRVKQIGNNTADAERKRFNDTLALFQKYGPKYGFDPVMLAAQGYQESQLRQDARSHVGAIGIMQIMPATGKDLKVGDITVAEANVHGGAKYMDQLMTLYFKDANFSPTNRSLFAFASYNAGPGRIAQMRKEAEKRGFDPNLWFNNVEIVTAEKVGIETTTYVRNIYKYYVSYTLLLESQEDLRKAREALSTPAK
ncbi:MAG TPA: transglycosylase SLT domain-containing protein [Burkholderiaceae bacterium]|nr:transglycosylase SLT domain-containing protein [Burkholderiaceae bacterium]HQR76329.1 transglycosylase SLT domain-containing protein [Burkholderiaceae bacterium]